jgi:hypothetical protein
MSVCLRTHRHTCTLTPSHTNTHMTQYDQDSVPPKLFRPEFGGIVRDANMANIDLKGKGGDTDVTTEDDEPGLGKFEFMTLLKKIESPLSGKTCVSVSVNINYARARTHTHTHTHTQPLSLDRSLACYLCLLPQPSPLSSLTWHAQTCRARG